MKHLWKSGFLLMVLAVCGQLAASPGDVSPSHWAYQSVQELAQKGLILGYPTGDFLGNRTLTRYEMATLIQRALRKVDNRIASAAKQSEPEDVSNTANRTPTATSAAVSRTDLDAVRKLVDEFKVELTIIGTDLAAYKEKFDKLSSDLEMLKEQVVKPDGANQTTIADVKKLKKIKISGYVQARYEAGEDARDASDDPSVTDPAKLSAYDSKSKFNVRRARIKIAGNLGTDTAATVQADFGGTSVSVKDAYLEYFLKGDPTVAPTFTFGQFKWPFGYEVVQSSSVRETPERARITTTLFPGERDRGIKFSTATDTRYLWELGLFNGSGANLNDNNQTKDIVSRFRYAVRDNFDFGVSIYLGKQDFINSGDVTQGDKNRWGADFQYYLPKMSVKGEYMAGDHPVAGVIRSVDGWWTQVARNLSKRDTAVVKYETYNDRNTAASSPGVLSAWNLGWIHALDEATRLKLFYEINQEERNDFDNNLLRLEVITLF